MMCVVLHRAKNVIHNIDPMLLVNSTLPCLNVYWLLSEDQMIVWVPNFGPSVLTRPFWVVQHPLFGASLDNESN